jgi:hypothetical protein
LNLKWSEHRSWMQIKTDLPRGVRIKLYSAELIDEKTCMIWIQDMEENWYFQNINLCKKAINIQIAPLSATGTDL